METARRNEKIFSSPAITQRHPQSYAAATFVMQGRDLGNGEGRGLAAHLVPGPAARDDRPGHQHHPHTIQVDIVSATGRPTGRLIVDKREARHLAERLLAACED